MSKEQKKIILAHHSLIYSSSQALRDYIRQYTNYELLYISHPLPEVSISKKDRSYCEISKSSAISHKRKVKKRFYNLFLSLIYEAFLTLKWSLRMSGKYDLYIGVDNFNALIGLLLKCIGKVDRVVYYTIDYFPTRYKNKNLNKMYHFIDMICVRYCDETWNVSSQMKYARKKNNNMNGYKYRRQYTVPIGVWTDQVVRKPFSKINKKKIIFVGHLVPHMGVDLVVRALPHIKRRIPDVVFEIVGGGEELENLKALAAKLKLGKNIKFYGWIRDRSTLEKILSDGAVGLAPFNTDILDEKVKNADPGKIKDYLLLGLPVIMTNSVKTAKKLTDMRVAIVVEYKEHEFTRAVVDILNNEKKLEEYRNNAISYIEQFNYRVIFNKNLKRILSS